MLKCTPPHLPPDEGHAHQTCDKSAARGCKQAGGRVARFWSEVRLGSACCWAVQAASMRERQALGPLQQQP